MSSVKLGVAVGLRGPVAGDGDRHGATWWERAWANPRVVWCFALIPQLVALVVSVRSVMKGHRPGNLIDFLGASREMLAGRDIYAGGTGGYIYPPLIAFLYQPLAMMTERDAAYVAMAVNAALSVLTLAVVSAVLVERLIGRRDRRLAAQVALVGAVLTADKIRGEFYHVETNVLMLVAFTAAMRWVDRRPWLCGMALGFAFNVKYWPVVLVPYLCLRRRWAAVAWFAAWAAVFGILPAASMGWAGDARAWAEASGGLLRLFGVDAGVARSAQLRPMTDAISVSLTSGVARVWGLGSVDSLAVAAVIGSLFCAAAVWVYVRNRVPVVAWPAVGLQKTRPYRGLFTIEWMAFLLMILIFGPFTNARHLYMLLDVNIAAGVLLLGTGGVVRRWPLALAMVVLFVGVTFPPGGNHAFAHSLGFWHRVGGPGWCMLGMCAALIWTNVRYQQAAGDDDVAADASGG